MGKRAYSKFMHERILYFETVYKNPSYNQSISEQKHSDNTNIPIDINELLFSNPISTVDIEIKIENESDNIHQSSIGIIGGKKPKEDNKKKTIDDQLDELDMLIDKCYKENNKPIRKRVNLVSSHRINKKESKSKNRYCLECKIIFKSDDDYKEHMDKHNNLTENSVCVCKKCGLIFKNDESYGNHDCKTDVENSIPENPFGTYNCPACDKKYDNAFYLGEHFILNHNDYDILRTLDNRIHNGFPGYKILYKIGMVKQFKRNSNIIDEKCDICFFNYTYDKSEISKSKHHEDILLDNRNPILMNCCKRVLCHDCLMHHITTTDSIICPFCRKDHTRDDLNYIIFVDIVNEIDKSKWIPWWENHMEVFLS